jgi:hyperosmotically inducible periplasmic protein
MRAAPWLLLISLICFAPACSNEVGTDTDKDTATAPSTPAPANTDADNTARNAEINTTETATAQGENAADREITAAIRKSVVDDSALSLNAHNVKIITAGGVVTLRGPVKSDSEKQTIESKAKQVAGVSRVDNLLEVEKKQ